MVKPAIISFLVVMWAVLPGRASAQVNDPLAAMEGRWTDTESGDCATKWFEYSVASDRRSFTTRYANGTVRTDIILHIEPNKVYLFYSDEKRRTPQGDLLVWWFILDGPKVYRMRRIDWPANVHTKDSWRKC